jgi:hypothetical protein
MTTSGLSDSFNSANNQQKIQANNFERKNRKFRLYNLLFTGVASLPMISVSCFNWLIDPYDVFNTPNFWGVNQEKIEKDNSDRLFKAVNITRIKPTTILMGSSRTKQGLNPEHPALKNEESVYNLAINGPNFYEVRRYIEHAIANQPNLKRIVLGVDFFMFNSHLENQPSFSEQRLEKKHLILTDAINALFSIDTFNVSRETIFASLEASEKDINYGKNGFMPNRNIDNNESIWRFNQSIKLYFQLHSDYEFSDKYWSDFEAVVALCKKNNIDLKVFISPSHGTDLEAIAITNQWSIFEEWKRKLVQLTPVWDFSGYNSITSEPIANKMSNYVDNSHYSPTIGNLILDRVFNYQADNVPQDFGILLTSENVEKNLSKINSDRITWTKNNPDEVNLVNKIMAQVKEEASNNN